ncbi:MAG: DNA polymerase III subunit gamma/tau, partial [Bilophila wadsworthia]
AASRPPVPPRPVAAPAAPARPAVPQGTPPWETATPAPSEQSEPSATVAPTDAPHPLDTAPAKDAASAKSKKKHASTVPAPSEAWMDFVEFCRKNQSDVTLSLPALTQANGVFSEGVLTLATTSAIQYEQLSAPSRLSELERLASDYSGKAVSVQVSAPERLHKTEAELKKEFASHPVIKSLTETFGASLIRCIPVEHTRS